MVEPAEDRYRSGVGIDSGSHEIRAHKSKRSGVVEFHFRFFRLAGALDSTAALRTATED
jgi:hypothetical protein